MRYLTGGLLLAGAAFFLINAALQLGLGYWLLNQLDLRFEAWGRLLIVPPLQALVLWLVNYRTRIHRAVRSLIQFLIQDSSLLLSLLIDVTVLIGAWYFADHSWANLQNERSIPILFMALKAIAASLLLFFLMVRRPMVRTTSLAIGACLLLLFGLDFFLPWQNFLVALLPAGAPVPSDLVTYGCFYAAGLLVLLRSALLFQAFSEESGLLLNAAALFSAASLPLLGVALFQSALLPSPWHLATKSMIFMAVTAIWLSILTAQRHLRTSLPQPVTSGG